VWLEPSLVQAFGEQGRQTSLTVEASKKQKVLRNATIYTNRMYL
jgi:hypothetical protein